MRAFIYLRVSSSQQEEHGAGLDVQRDACLAYIKQHGYTLIGEFTDAHTGTEYRERRHLTEMRDRLRNGEVDVVVAYAVDRLSRNQAHIAILLEEAEHAGAHYEFATEKFENTAVGKLVLSVRAFAAEVEREKIIMRTLGGRHKRVDGGMMLAGRTAPYGYEWVEENGKKVGFRIVPHEAAFIRTMYLGLLAGKSINSQVKELTETGHRTRSGSRWGSSNVSQMLKNSIYKGDPTAFRYSGRTTARKASRRGVDAKWEKPEGRVIEGGSPAIVDKDTWEAAILILEHNQQNSDRNTKNPEEALLRGGFAVCGYCGCALGHVSERVRRRGPDGSWVSKYPRQYRCRPTNKARHDCPSFAVDGNHLDAAVWAEVEAKVLDPDFITNLMKRHESEDPTLQERQVITRALADREKKLKNIQAIIPTIEDEDFRATIVQQANEHTAQRRALLSELTSLDERRATWVRHQSKIASIERWLDGLRLAIQSKLTWQQRRVVLDACGIKVRVFQRRHDPPALLDFALPTGDNIESVVLHLDPAVERDRDPIIIVHDEKEPVASLVNETTCRSINSSGHDFLKFSVPLAV